MRFRDQVALTLPALVLRLALATIFIWAGLAKVLSTVPVTPEQAADLATLGVPVTPTAETSTTPTPRLPDPEGDADADAPDETENTTDPSGPAGTLPDPSASLGAPFALHHAAWTQDAENPDATETDTPADGSDATADTPAPEAEDAEATRTTAGLITAADYPNGGTVRMVETLALVIDHAANPPLDAESNRPDPIWPSAIGNGPWPRVLAWSVALTELIAGILILLGLFTRLASLGIFGVMLGAMWLTEIGPAMQSSSTMLGFLPDYALSNPQAWTKLWFQFTLTMVALALFFLGAGAVSLDRGIFRRRRDDFDANPSYSVSDPPPESQRPV